MSKYAWSNGYRLSRLISFTRKTFGRVWGQKEPQSYPGENRGIRKYSKKLWKWNVQYDWYPLNIQTPVQNTDLRGYPVWPEQRRSSITQNELYRKWTFRMRPPENRQVFCCLCTWLGKSEYRHSRNSVRIYLEVCMFAPMKAPPIINTSNFRKSKVATIASHALALAKISIIHNYGLSWNARWENYQVINNVQDKWMPHSLLHMCARQQPISYLRCASC